MLDVSINVDAAGDVVVDVAVDAVGNDAADVGALML